MQNELIGKLRDAISRNFPDVNRIEVSLVLLGESHFGSVHLSGGAYHSPVVHLADEVFAIAAQLKDAMHEPVGGAWITCKVIVWSTGSISTEFDYDGRPDVQGLITPSVAEEMVRYPRGGNFPDWMYYEVGESVPHQHVEVVAPKRGLEGDPPQMGPANNHRPVMARSDAENLAVGFQPEEGGLVYLRIVHNYVSEQDPITVFLELDAELYEVRKVAYFPNGGADWASLRVDGIYVELEDDPLSIDDIDGTASEITPEQFQIEWLYAGGPQ